MRKSPSCVSSGDAVAVRPNSGTGLADKTDNDAMAGEPRHGFHGAKTLAHCDTGVSFDVGHPERFNVTAM
jgi:hypothetical protein